MTVVVERKALKAHSAAELFPPLASEELQALADDIRERGLIHPIVIHDDKILDGRNRYEACKLAGVEPRTEVYKGKDPIGYVISANLARRHLNESQRAMVAAKLATLKHGQRADRVEGSIELSTAGKRLNVGKASVKRARVVREKGVAELVRAVEAGKIPVSKGAEITEMTDREQKKVVQKVEEGMTPAKAVRAVYQEASIGTPVLKGEWRRNDFLDEVGSQIAQWFKRWRKHEKSAKRLIESIQMRVELEEKRDG